MDMNFDMDKLQVLTQEMFDSWCEKAKNGPVEVSDIVIDNCLIDGLIISEKAIYRKKFIDFTFEHCYIKEICIDESFKIPTKEYINNIEFNECVITSIKRLDTDATQFQFNKCTILDPKKIDNYELHTFISCDFYAPFNESCPEEGEFVGYKKCIIPPYIEKMVTFNYDAKCVVKLLIPSDAKRIWTRGDTPFSRYMIKCRCSKAKVLGIYDLNGNKLSDDIVAVSKYGGHDGIESVTYKTGEWVYPDSFDDDDSEACSHGIHFFMKFEDAANY